MRTLENAVRRWGFYRVAGCDEVGRGCLAGPVVAGAVILDPECHIPGLADSKTITAAERERLYDVITRKALAWSVASAEPDEIDDDQHPSGVAAGDAARGAGDRAAARHGAGRCVPHSRSRHRAARRAARRSALRRDRRGLDRRQGHARSRDDDAPRSWTRATATTATRATPRPIISPPSRATAIRRCTAARSGRRETCLIRWTSGSRRSRLNARVMRLLADGILLRGRTRAGDRSVVDVLGAELFRAGPAGDRAVAHQRLRARRGVGPRPGEPAGRPRRDLVVSDDAPRSGSHRLDQPRAAPEE